MKHARLAFVLAALAVLPCAVRAQTPAYAFTLLGTLDRDRSYGSGVNSFGQATGTADLERDFGTSNRAFLYTRGKGMTDLGTLGGANGYGYGINDKGQVVGATTYANADYTPRAFLYTAGVGLKDLGALGGPNSEAFGVNNAGQVAGAADIEAIADNGLHFQHAFLYAPGTGMQDLGSLGGPRSGATAINEAGQVTGYAYDKYGNARAFLYTPDEGMQDIGTLGGAYSEGRAINNRGQIAGEAAVSGNPYPHTHAFLYSNGKMTDLGTLYADTESQAFGVNDDGQVVGSSEAPQQNGNSFLYTPGKGMQDLNLLVPADTPWRLSYGTAISNNGYITGYCYRPNNNIRAFLLTPLWSVRPALTRIRPRTAKAGGAAFPLTVTGTGFVPTSVVKVGGVTVLTAFVSPTRLTASVPASLIAKTGTFFVKITTPHVATSTARPLVVAP